jgi:hypothetical protein
MKTPTGNARAFPTGTTTSATTTILLNLTHTTFVSRLLRLTLLAPDIQEAILEGRQAKGMQLEELTRVMSGAWEEQRRLLHTASSASSAR